MLHLVFFLILLQLISFFNAAHHYLSSLIITYHCLSLLYFFVVAENCCGLYILVSMSVGQVKHAECAIETTSHSRHIIETTDAI